ncbi:VOC family protein [Streptomyces sp. NPDC048637]|uniref:VOC family protein n=1 Tax=Streptomyces sp. NPDC048637 TaxID=3155636 RepID=UPI00342026CB
MFTGIRTIMIFAEDPDEAAGWWSHLLDTPVHREVAGTHVYAWLDVGGVEFGFHMLDEQRNKRGGSPVPYWSVDDIESALTKLLAEGCTQHRGPLDIGDGTGRQIAQVVDPFGNIIGIDGP